MGEIPFMTPPRIKSLETRNPCTLVLIWENGARTIHDLKSFVADKPWAKPLTIPAIFRSAKLAADGHEVTWPGTEIDFSAAGLWEDIHPRPALTAKWMSLEAFRRWRAEMGYSFDEAATELGSSTRMLKYYASGMREVPKRVWLACMHLAAQKSRSIKPLASPRVVLVDGVARTGSHINIDNNVMPFGSASLMPKPWQVTYA